MSEKKVIIQKIWGVALLVAGVCMFFSIPSKINEIQLTGGYSSGQVIFLQACFYIMSLVLTLGGSKKLYRNFGLKEEGTQDKTESK